MDMLQLYLRHHFWCMSSFRQGASSRKKVASTGNEFKGGMYDE